MRTNTKIRWLLLIVTIGLFATALTARWASTRSFNLEQSGKEITHELAERETFIYEYIKDPEKFARLRKLSIDGEEAREVIETFTSRLIYFQVFKNNKLVFWSDNRVSDMYAHNLKDGTNFVGYSNGWYETVKKTQDDFFVVFYIPVKSNYPYQNQYLNTYSDPEIIKDPTIDIATLADQSVIDIKGIDDNYLFSLTRTSFAYEIPYSNIEIYLWLCGLILFALFINSSCVYYAEKGRPWFAILLMTLAFGGMRAVCLLTRFPAALYNQKIFSPNIFATNLWFPSLGDLALNVIGVLWIVIFIYNLKSKLFFPVRSKWLIYSSIAIGAIAITLFCNLLSDIFFGLVFNSNINFKVTNLINLDGWSVIGIGILLLALLIFYLFLEILISFSYYLRIRLKEKIAILLIILIAYNVYQAFLPEYNVYFLLIFLLILIIGRVVYQFKGTMIFPAMVLITLIFATIVSIKLNTYESIKELEMRKTLALKLESGDDPNALILFHEIDSNLVEDKAVKEYFSNLPRDFKALNYWFRKYYLSGYLRAYELNIIPFSPTGEKISVGKEDQDLQYYKKLVEAGSLKVSKNFYRVSNTFGIQNYFAILPLKKNGENIGTLVIELKSKETRGMGTFPQLLKDGKLTFIEDYVDYSYAYYSGSKLAYQSGNYVYSLSSKGLEGKYKDFVLVKKNGYSHLTYQSGPGKLIVISKESSTFWREIASLSFFFIIFLLFALLIVSYKWIWSLLISYRFNFRNFRFRLFVNSNQMLYRTRIQIALVLAVVTSLIIVGLITFSYISIQYKEQQEDLIIERVRIIAQNYEESLVREGRAQSISSRDEMFSSLAKMYNTDLNLYNTEGTLLNSTQLSMYNMGIIAPRINPKAFISLNIKQRSEFIQEERIGDLTYISAYMPIRDGINNVVGYLQLPYFSNQNDFNQKIGNFLNLLINIYVLVFVAIGFFAFVVANQITNPLTLIQESMASMAIGRKNKPISWKRNDEIGNLIREYNKMILALEDSANKLARSEREIAWREMAKQVAHEIKNPLTPLRLGIQMLTRSWNEKDPNFDQKFDKFSKSFLEQIDSLSHIASEFSNFAKMPDLKLEDVELNDVLNQAIQIYKQMEHVQIFCQEEKLEGVIIRADKDQLLRSFNNLFKNAIEAMAEGTEGIIKIFCILYEKKVEIIVQDNGRGIPDELKEQIFTPNFTTKSSGTGLGLAFVKQAIENIGGSIYFTTEINKGTAFHIILPLVRKG